METLLGPEEGESVHASGMTLQCLPRGGLKVAVVAHDAHRVVFNLRTGLRTRAKVGFRTVVVGSFILLLSSVLMAT